ncbi:MAG: hypothetical protein AAFQ82_11120, partial [Myxococcota bacterium]
MKFTPAAKQRRVVFVIYPTLLLAGILAQSPIRASELNSRTVSEVQLDAHDVAVEVYLGVGLLNQSSIGPLPIDEGTTRVDPVTFERELRQIGDYIRQGYILKRGFRPCEATVLDVQPRGRPIHFQVSLRFACVETGDPNIEVRFANEFPRPHEHVISMSDRDGRAKQYPLNRPYTLRLARGMPGEVMWVFGGAGLRAVFGVAPVLA